MSRIGESNQGRPVWGARVGHGPVRILYITQQHGNEPLGTPAALRFLAATGVGRTAAQRWLRSRVTVDVVVRANPDGHEHDWRYNHDPSARPGHGKPRKGYDLNRYHDPHIPPADNPATEAGLIQRHYAGFRPEIVVDYHMQGRYVLGDGREITASLMWPTTPGVTPSAGAFARQIAVVAQRAMTAAGGTVTQFPGGEYRGIARNAYGLCGSGSVLVELSDLGAEHERAQIDSALRAMLAVAWSAADGSVERVDPGAAERLRPR
ncbi:M14 family zinc carboxypeptidase [Prauserella oleivorans]